MSDTHENILIIGPAWVGDMVMAQSLFKLLEQEYPDCRITVMAPDWTRPLLERMPEVDDTLPAPLGHGELQLGRRRRLGRALRPEAFTTAIILPNSFKSALIPFHAGIPRRIGWRGEWRNLLLSDCRRLDKAAFPQMVQRFAALALPPGATPPSVIPPPALVVDADNARASLARFNLSEAAPVLAICPGAEYGESKQWPPMHFAELSNHYLAQGWQVWIFGSANDQLAAESVLADIESEFLPHLHNLAGRTALGEAIDLLDRAAVVASNDSGLMHIAAALGKPVVALYGSTSPDFTPPLAERVKLLHTDIECRPCFKRECPYGHRRCLVDLGPERAVAAVQELFTLQAK